MYVKFAISGQKVVALVNSRATHNFEAWSCGFSGQKVMLSLKFSKDDNKLKVVNSHAHGTHSLAKNVVV